MGSVVILIIIVVASLICVRAGAIALELTGAEMAICRVSGEIKALLDHASDS